MPRVVVQLFAGMAERAGVRKHVLELDQATLHAGDVVSAMTASFPEMGWPSGTRIAVNEELVDDLHPLQDGDRIAIIPPVSGG